MVLAMPHQAESSMDSARRRILATASRRPVAGSARGQLLEQLAHDVDADAAGTAAAARFLLDEPEVRQARSTRQTSPFTTTPRQDTTALIACHVGLLQTGEHLLGSGPSYLSVRAEQGSLTVISGAWGVPTSASLETVSQLSDDIASPVRERW